MVAIIIPACNEEALIERTIGCLLANEESDRLDVIVCCNGCSDRTALLASRMSGPIRVLEMTVGSKTAAFNMGDAVAVSHPRIYLDADITLSETAIQSITQALKDPRILAVAPRMLVDVTGRNWFIRAFYDVWLRTPYHEDGMIGSGVYALSEAGRARFGKFPNIIADDAFVRAQFDPHERRVLNDCYFTVRTPTTIGSLLKIKTRAALGNMELAAKYPALVARNQSNDRRHRRWGMLRMALQPRLWPKLCVYGFVKLVARVRANSQWNTLNAYRWERDDSSRVPAANL